MAGAEHVLGITRKINDWAGSAAVRVYEDVGGLLGVQVPYNPEFPIPQEVIQTWILLGLLGTVGYVTTRSLSIEEPRGLAQHVWESFLEIIENLLNDVVGHGSRAFIPFIAGLSLFILAGNLQGLFPFSASPTSTLNTTVACSVVACTYYHVQGLRRLGFRKYAAHFMGPSLPLAPLMVPIELVSHLSRVISLALRLFGNIMGEDFVILILFAIMPIGGPVPMMAFAIFTSILQAFIFVMLTMMYLAGAVAEEH